MDCRNAYLASWQILDPAAAAAERSYIVKPGSFPCIERIARFEQIVLCVYGPAACALLPAFGVTLSNSGHFVQYDAPPPT